MKAVKSTVVKSLLAILLMGSLFWFEIITVDALAVIAKRPEKTIVAFLMLGLAFFVGVLRWQVLLSAVDIHIKFNKLTQIYGASIFFGNILPGSIGGDAIRALYIVREIKGGIGHENINAMSTIIADRAMGLIGFMSLGCILIFIQSRLGVFSQSIQNWHQTIILFMLALIGIGSLAFLYAKIMRKKWMSPLENSHRLKKILYTLHHCLVQVIELYGHRKKALLQAFLLSLILSGLVVSVIPILAKPFEYVEISHLNYLIASVIANLSNVIPLTPGGIGIGEGVFNHICHLLESTETSNAYGNIFFQARIALTLINVLGVFGFILYSQSAKNHELIHVK